MSGRAPRPYTSRHVWPKVRRIRLPPASTEPFWRAPVAGMRVAARAAEAGAWNSTR
jgi:hypothetical protein